MRTPLLLLSFFIVTTGLCAQVPGSPYMFRAKKAPSGGEIPGNATCEEAFISVTSCNAVAGASVNDDAGTTLGVEYDWTDATGYVAGGTTRALVEIGGQCWYRRNSINAPTSPCSDAPNTGCNIWLNTIITDLGKWGYYHNTTTNGTAGWRTTEPGAGEGLLYQWSAAMNGSTTERAQGVCHAGWHIPSDCEIMFLEDTLGMSVADQQAESWRDSGTVGSKLSTLTSGGTNSSGFSVLLTGQRGPNGAFTSRAALSNWITSTEATATNQWSRGLLNTKVGQVRNNTTKAYAWVVRCVKD